MSSSTTGDPRDDLLGQLVARFKLADEGGEWEMRSLATGVQLIDHLAQCRREAGLSQAVVAKTMGTNQATVARLETHRHDPRLSTLMRYIAALGERSTDIIPALEDAMRQPAQPAAQVAGPHYSNHGTRPVDLR